MFAVKFGNGVAIEIRDVMNRLTLYYHVGLVMDVTLPPPLMNYDSAGAFVDHVDHVWRCLAGATEHQFIFFCSDIEPFTLAVSEKFEAKHTSTFGKPHDSIVPTGADERGRMRAELSEDGKLRPRCWLVDTSNGCVYSVRFQFALPIYQSTVFTGSLTPESVFTIRKLVKWCGAKPESLQFARQQLSFWFNTPATEQCWFRPNAEKDCFKFMIDIEDELVVTKPNLPMLSASPDGTLHRWSDRARIECSNSVFRIYRTQYPFIYTLMPDDDERVTSLKAELKNSTGALQPLVITIPTMDCELGEDHEPLRGEKLNELTMTNSTQLFVPHSKETQNLLT